MCAINVVVAMAALLASQTATCGEWRYTGRSTDTAVFVGQSTIVRSGKTAAFWEMVIFREPLSGVKSSKRRTVVDCSTLRAYTVQMIDYDAADRAGVPLNYTRTLPNAQPTGDAARALARRFACGDPAAIPATVDAAIPATTANMAFQTQNVAAR